MTSRRDEAGFVCQRTTLTFDRHQETIPRTESQAQAAGPTRLVEKREPIRELIGEE